MWLLLYFYSIKPNESFKIIYLNLNFSLDIVAHCPPKNLDLQWEILRSWFSSLPETLLVSPCCHGQSSKRFFLCHYPSWAHLKSVGMFSFANLTLKVVSLAWFGSLKVDSQLNELKAFFSLCSCFFGDMIL